MPELTPELQKINEALVAFDRELSDPSNKMPSNFALNNFIKALFDLWLFIRFNHSSEDVGVAEKLRLTYIRRFLEKVPALPALKEEYWFNIHIWISPMKADLEQLFPECPELRGGFECFFSLYPAHEFERRKQRLKHDLEAQV